MKLIDHRYALNLSVVCRTANGWGWCYLGDPGDVSWWDSELWSRRN